MSAAECIAGELRGLVRSAAEPVKPGETVKAQMNRAWAVLGRPPFWRLKSAWYGEAGSWGGVAIEDMRQRAARRREQEDNARGEAARLAEVYAAAIERLRTIDPDHYGREIARMERAVGIIGDVDCAGTKR